MPVYEYRCVPDGHRFEQLRGMDDPSPESCPECGGDVRRVWGRVGVRFSGWGFSRTDALLPEDRRHRDFKTVRERAERLADSD